jgi:hypothetical protein
MCYVFKRTDAPSVPPFSSYEAHQDSMGPTQAVIRHLLGV